MYDQDMATLKALQYCPDPSEVTPKEYIRMFIEYVTDIFNKERGRDETKKANLGDIKSTQIDTALIIQQPLRNGSSSSNITDEVIMGNVKALIPVLRER
jgi:hypothetical protein